MAFFNEINDASNFIIGFSQDPRRDFDIFAKGYTLAASRLANSLLEASRFSDYEAYPVAFLYRHAFELSLKHVIYESARLASFRFSNFIDDKLQNSHNLKMLSVTVGKSLKAQFPHDILIDKVVKSIIEVADEWTSIDPNSYSYRYPINTKGQPSTSDHQRANLRSISIRMSELLEELETIHFGLNIESDQAAEIYKFIENLAESISNDL